MFVVTGGDVVTSAPELARLTLNIAKVHHDAAASGQGRLVYGGHTIGLALHQAVRALPELVTVVAWHGCDHTGPVREGDTDQHHRDRADRAARAERPGPPALTRPGGPRRRRTGQR